MKTRITPIRRHGIEMYHIVVIAWNGEVLLNTCRWSEQGARIALMQWNLKNGVIN